MEALKFAFDTLVVGALGLPWLWLFMRIFFQRRTSEQDNIKFPILSALSESVRQNLGLVLIIAIGYFLGSAITRISSDFFDDSEILQRMPTRSSIQQGVYLHEYCDEHSVLVAIPLPVGLAKQPGGKAAFCNEDKRELLVSEFFRLQEGKLLLEGEEKLGRVREFHDQIEILRGATLNGVILFILSWFGLCALYRTRLNLPGQQTQNQPPANANPPKEKGFFDKLKNKISADKLRILLTYASYAPAVACLLLGLWEMSQHFVHQHESSEIKRATGNSAPTSNPYETHDDPPLAEAVLVLLGVGGLCLRLTDDNPRLFRNVCLIAGVLTLIAYGSWWWTEVLYDQQVIHSFPTNIQYTSNTQTGGK
jgi:hypothetical protein